MERFVLLAMMASHQISLVGLLLMDAAHVSHNCATALRATDRWDEMYLIGHNPNRDESHWFMLKESGPQRSKAAAAQV